MKRILIIVATIICFCPNAKAQVFMGGELSRYNLSYSGKQKYGSFMPCVGYQYKKLAFGMVFSYQKVNSTYVYKEKAIELFPFVRYYLFNKNKLSLFIEADFAYSIHKTIIDVYSYQDVERYHAVRCSPGIQYYLSPRCAAVAFFGFVGYSDSYWYGYKDFGCSLGLNTTTLSFYYYFGK